MTDEKDLGDKCVYCGEDTSMGSGRFVNRLGIGTTSDCVPWLSAEEQAERFPVSGWGCAECSGFECDKCEKQIYLDADITDKDENGHYHRECLPLDQHYVDPDDVECWCGLHEVPNV